MKQVVLKSLVTALCCALFYAPYSMAEQVVTKDSNGFARILVDSRSPGEALLLRWSGSSHGYGRDVKVVRIVADGQVSSELKGDALVNKWNEIYRDQLFVVDKASEKTIASGSQEVPGVQIENTDFKETIRQIQGGANVFNKNPDPQAFVNENKWTLEDFTREKSIQLTRKYGADFASKVYKELLVQDGNTKESMNEFTNILREQLKQNAKDIRFTSDVEFWVAKGFMQNTEDAHKVKGMFENVLAQMGDQGLSVNTFKTKTADPVQVNADIIAAKIKERAKEGKQIVILAISKAVPEVLGALSQLSEEKFFADPKKEPVRGVILTAGPQEGMHFADFATMPIVFNVIKSKMIDMAAANKVDITHLQEGLKSLSHSRLGAFYNRILPSLPQLRYINMIGVSKSINGMAEYKPLRSMQEGLFSRWFFQKHGANDGIVEYSSLLRTKNLGSMAMTLVADGDHCIFPCKFDGQIVDSVDDQLKSFSALMEFLKSESKGRTCEGQF